MRQTHFLPTVSKFFTRRFHPHSFQRWIRSSLFIRRYWHINLVPRIISSTASKLSIAMMDTDDGILIWVLAKVTVANFILGIMAYLAFKLIK